VCVCVCVSACVSDTHILDPDVAALLKMEVFLRGLMRDTRPSAQC
jgi:hypothetical protein